MPYISKQDIGHIRALRVSSCGKSLAEEADKENIFYTMVERMFLDILPLNGYTEMSDSLAVLNDMIFELSRRTGQDWNECERSIEYEENHTQPQRLSEIVDAIKSVPSKKIKGAFNYTVSRLGLIAFDDPKTPIEILLHLDTALRESLMNPYEDYCIKKNGDLPELEQL